jgi:hypothetical protein
MSFQAPGELQPASRIRRDCAGQRRFDTRQQVRQRSPDFMGAG